MTDMTELLTGDALWLTMLDWALVSMVLIITGKSLVSGATTKGYEDGHDEGYKEGYEDGYSSCFDGD